ncbi:MAG TPA: hypothetical protein VE397_04500 [Stellaceae bacterium]|nr:hypothetical protein [Stellaceae bacterium]
MQTLIVRPVMTGLLALIIAGYWGAPLGLHGLAAAPAPAACRGVAAPGVAPLGIIGAARRGLHC